MLVTILSVLFLTILATIIILKVVETQREINRNRIEIEQFDKPENRRAKTALFLYRFLIKRAFEDRGVVLIRYPDGVESEVPLPLDPEDWVSSEVTGELQAKLKLRSRELASTADQLDNLATPLTMITVLLSAGAVGCLTTNNSTIAAILAVLAGSGFAYLWGSIKTVLTARRVISRIEDCLHTISSNEHWTGRAWVYPKDVVEAAQEVYEDVA